MPDTIKIFFSFVIFLICTCTYAQTNTYTLNGSARQNSCNCYTLTPDINNQSGSVWNKNTLNLTAPFDFWFNVNLGCKDAKGADGIAFILQTVPNSIGRFGSGMGFAGVSPSIGIALDTYQNIDHTQPENDLDDPSYDHISIQANGVVKHGNDLAGPVPISATSSNVEDCQWHVLRITWNPITKWLRSYFDDSLRVEAQIDLITTIFNNNPNVYWGFAGATGGASNVQRFCTALNPQFITNLSANSACNSATVNFQDQSISFAPIESYSWSFGDGTSSNLPNPPAHFYAQPGLYPIQLTITAKDGCKSDSTITVAIGSKPVADFTVMDACYKAAPFVIDKSASKIGAISTWNWSLNGMPLPPTQHPQFTTLPIGVHQLQLSVSSVYGCTSDVVSKPFTVKELPKVQLSVKDSGCANESIAFNAQQTDNATTIHQWSWNFGDNATASNAATYHTYTKANIYPVQLWAIADNGCSSDTMTKSIEINQAYAFAGNDTIVLKNVPFLLKGEGNGDFKWSPSSGLSDDAIKNPVATLSNDQTYQLTVTTAEGCVAADTINIVVFKGSAIYVPDAFTPNGDGRNDRLKPMYVGIKKLYYFTIYNRWGQRMFYTTNINEGWDGRDKGLPLSTGTYIWIVKAVDIPGKIYELKGTVTIIR